MHERKQQKRISRDQASLQKNLSGNWASLRPLRCGAAPS